MKLSICIPNYERLNLLTRLVSVCCERITADGLEDLVEICVSDDCSNEDPTEMICEVRSKYPNIFIVYLRNQRNMGMDHNFLQSVLMASGEYAWIIGNDDLPTENGIGIVIKKIREYPGFDFLVSPFDILSDSDDYESTVYPLKDPKRERVYNTNDENDYDELIGDVARNTALFDFLSNVVFLRNRWVKHGDMFKEKMNSIFIQIYMNLQTLNEGAIYVYSPEKIICQYTDNEVNSSYKRRFDIIKGLNEVINYFYVGDANRHLHNIWMDHFLDGELYEIDHESEEFRYLATVSSDKADIYNKYYIRKADRADAFSKKKIVICGAGKRGKETFSMMKKLNADVMFFCDRDKSKQGGYIDNIEVKDYQALYDERNMPDYVVVSCFMCEIVGELEGNGIFNIAVVY